MKKITAITIILCFIFNPFDSWTQVAINTDGSAPASSAMLDVSSDTAGMLIPRMTTTQRDAISSPAEGLLIYNSTEDKFDYYNGGAWRTMISSTNSSGSSAEGSGFCSEGVTDYDGNIYSTVKIGNKCWMAENLRSNNYSDGTTITGAYNYDDANYNARAYGKLYTWAALMNGASSSDANPSGVQGVCPTGWHVPSETEWKILEYTLGMSFTEYNTSYFRGTHGEGLKLKETDNAQLWQISSATGNNLTGFSALPAGLRAENGTYTGIYQTIGFWSCTEYDATHPYYRWLRYNEEGIARDYDIPKTIAMSVRCVRD